MEEFSFLWPGDCSNLLAVDILSDLSGFPVNSLPRERFFGILAEDLFTLCRTSPSPTRPSPIVVVETLSLKLHMSETSEISSCTESDGKAVVFGKEGRGGGEGFGGEESLSVSILRRGDEGILGFPHCEKRVLVWPSLPPAPPILVPKYPITLKSQRSKTPPPPHSEKSNPALKSVYRHTKYYKSVKNGVIASDGDHSVVIGKSDVSYLLPGALGGGEGFGGEESLSVSILRRDGEGIHHEI